MTSLPLTSLITLLIGLLMLALGINVGRARGAAAVGAVWLIARIGYALAYQADPAKRGPAFGLSFTAFVVLWLGALWGIVRVMAA
jgi:hypothetical protein